jgi:hypothetical protein
MLAAAALMLAARACANAIRRDLFDGLPLLSSVHGVEELAAIRTWMHALASALDAVAVGASPRQVPGSLMERLRALQAAAESTTEVRP